jgi:hypothetical protein
MFYCRRQSIEAKSRWRGSDYDDCVFSYSFHLICEHVQVRPSSVIVYVLMVTGRDRVGEAMSFAGQELVEGRDACFVAFLQYSCPAIVSQETDPFEAECSSHRDSKVTARVQSGLLDGSV